MTPVVSTMSDHNFSLPGPGLWRTAAVASDDDDEILDWDAPVIDKPYIESPFILSEAVEDKDQLAVKRSGLINQ